MTINTLLDYGIGVINMKNKEKVTLPTKKLSDMDAAEKKGFSNFINQDNLSYGFNPDGF